MTLLCSLRGEGGVPCPSVESSDGRRLPTGPAFRGSNSGQGVKSAVEMLSDTGPGCGGWSETEGSC